MNYSGRENVGIHLVDVPAGCAVVVVVYVATFVADLGDMNVGDASYLDLQQPPSQLQLQVQVRDGGGGEGRGDLGILVVRPYS